MSAGLAALALWHAEIRAGKRDNTACDFDALAAAAAWEKAAAEMESLGDTRGAAHCYGEARRRLQPGEAPIVPPRTGWRRTELAASAAGWGKPAAVAGWR